jgi:hypothetical protein
MKSVASLKTVRAICFQICLIFYNHSTTVAPETLKFISHVFADKKNENKEVAVNDFLPPTTSLEAIQHSM